MMRRFLLLTVFVVVCGGCGDAGSPTSTTPSPAAAADPAAPATTATTAEPNPSPLDAALDGLSVLALSATAGRLDEGEFALFPGDTPAALVAGHWWSTVGGNVYTRVDLDTGLVAAEMGRLVEEVLDPSDERLAEVLGFRDHYRGREFQLGLEDFIPAGPPPPDAMALLRLLYDGAGAAALAEVEECGNRVADFAVASDRFVLGLQPVFITLDSGEEEWLFPTASYLESVAPERTAAAAACNPLFELVADPAGQSLRLVRASEGSVERLDLLIDSGIYAEPREERAITLWIEPSSGSQIAPSKPAPAPMFTTLNQFLLAINQCGELPWIYSNFAAANTYTSPDDEGYEGPTPFDTYFPCADRVLPALEAKEDHPRGRRQRRGHAEGAPADLQPKPMRRRTVISRRN
jgi:hypothetical protein